MSDSQSVLNRGKGVCAGYANLFKDLCDIVGAECVKVSGFSKAYGYEIGSSFEDKDDDHAWIAMKLGKSYRYLEPTWGSGSLTKDTK